MTGSPVPRTRSSNVAKGALFFGALGPLVGFTVLLAAMVIWSVFEDGRFALGTRALGIALMFGVPAAYLIGVIPAALTGMIAGAQRSQLHHGSVMAILVVMGACAAAVPGVLAGKPISIVVTTTTGAISTLLVAWIFRNRATRPHSEQTPA